MVGVHCRDEIVIKGDDDELFKKKRLTEKDLDGNLKGVVKEGILTRGKAEDEMRRLARETNSDGKSAVADLLREVAAMLLLGQQRARENQKEEISGKGKWWAEKARWGGCKQDEEKQDGKKIEEGKKEEEKKEGEGNGQDLSEAQEKDLREKKQKERTMHKWREMQRPSSRWEKKVEYMHVGKSPGQEWDDVNSTFSLLATYLALVSPSSCLLACFTSLLTIRPMNLLTYQPC